MSRTATILVMSRGMRLHRLFREMVGELVKDHHVVVLAAPEEVASFSTIPGVDVRCYNTPDIPSVWPNGWTADETELKKRAREIETHIKLPLYKAAGNYLLYGRIVKSYGGWWPYQETETTLLRAYVGAYLGLSQIFEEVRPDVVFYETIDLISTYVAFALAYVYGVFAFDYAFSPLAEGKISLRFGLHRRNIMLEYLYAHRNAIEASSYASADEVLQDPQERLRGTTYARAHRAIARNDSLMNRDRLRTVWKHPQRIAQGVRNARWHYRWMRNRTWLDRHLSKEIPQEPYIVFFMQHLPEASTCSEAPQWVYQDSIAEQLALHAPSHLKVVVKEHPRTYGRRGRSFFGALEELPNIVLCAPFVDNCALISGAQAVLTITGSVGLDAVLLGKPVGVLGRPFYTAYPGVKQLAYPQDIYHVLQDPGQGTEELLGERRHFLAAYFQSLHEFSHGAGDQIRPSTGGEKWAEAMRKTVRFVRAHQLEPSMFDAGLS